MAKRMLWGCDRTAHLEPDQVKELRDKIRQRYGSLTPDPQHPLRCVRLRKDENPEFIGWIGDHRLFEANGVLPHAGGLHDQPARWVEAMHLIGGIVGDNT